VFDLPTMVPAGPTSRRPVNMPAGKRNAKHRAGSRLKPVGAAGTQAMASPGGSTNALRRPNPRQ
jgi:hypothetical protein